MINSNTMMRSKYLLGAALITIVSCQANAYTSCTTTTNSYNTNEVTTDCYDSNDYQIPPAPEWHPSPLGNTSQGYIIIPVPNNNW